MKLRALEFYGDYDDENSKKKKGFYRELIILEWILRNKFTTPKILTTVLDCSASSVSRTLRKMLKDKKIIFGYIPSLVVPKIILVSKLGLDYLNNKSSRSYEKRLVPSAINYESIVHKLCIQELLAKVSRFRFMTEFEIKKWPDGILRQPDIFYESTEAPYNPALDTKIMAIEFEHSRKNPIDRIKMLSCLALDIKAGYYNQVFIFSKYEKIINPIEKEMGFVLFPYYYRHCDTRKVVKNNDRWHEIAPVRDLFIIETTSIVDYYYLDSKSLHPKKPNKIK